MHNPIITIEVVIDALSMSPMWDGLSLSKQQVAVKNCLSDYCLMSNGGNC